MKTLRLLAVMTLCALPASARAETRDVSLKAPDGTSLKATYSSPGKPGPGIVLLHMCNSQRKAWTHLAELLTAQGFHTIALDYRGFGESGGGSLDGLDPGERRQFVQEKWPGDIDAAFDFLVAQTGVDRSRVGAAGGSCGVDNAIQLARRHPDVKALVLLAGGTTSSGEDFLARSPWLPIFASAAADDGTAVDTMRWLVGFSSGALNRLQEYPNGGHGTEMFAVHKDLEPAIVSWFDRHLVKSPVHVSASTTATPGPSARQSAALREPGGAARVLEEWRAAQKAGRTFPLAPEATVNALGYEYLQTSRVTDATGLFELNVEAHPASANTYDSLADAYLAAGNRAKAVEFARKALDTLSRDKTTPDDFKQQIRESAEDKIRLAGSGSERR